jgi:hypothetical protein
MWFAKIMVELEAQFAEGHRLETRIQSALAELTDG